MNYQEQRFKKLVLGMADVAKEYNAEFLTLMIPINFQVDETYIQKVLGSDKFSIQRNYFEEIKPWMDEHGIRHLDLLKAMRMSEERYYPLNGEVHFNPNGNAFTAKMIKEYFDRAEWL